MKNAMRGIRLNLKSTMMDGLTNRTFAPMSRASAEDLMRKENDMAEYIDRTKLIEACRKAHFAVSANEHPYDVVRRHGEIFKRCVDESPAEDVVEVVRCKDCDHFIECGDEGFCVTLMREMRGDDFCCFAIRKENQNERTIT